MTYTRKPRKTRDVTFTVSWIEEPITIPAVDCMSSIAIIEAEAGDPRRIVRELPSEISALLEICTGEELLEFLTVWNEKTAELNQSRQRTTNLFERIIGGLK